MEQFVTHILEVFYAKKYPNEEQFYLQVLVKGSP
jgi:hypothetical protein